MFKPEVVLQSSEIITEQLVSWVYAYDISVRQLKGQSRILYIGQGSQVIQVPEEDLDKFIEFIKKGLSLPLIHETMGWLK